MNMRKNIRLFLILGLIIGLTACSKKDKDEEPTPSEETLKPVTVEDLPANPHSRDSEGEVVDGTDTYTFFRFSDSTIVPNSDSASTKWDIGFRNTTIILNSGVNGPGNVEGQVLQNILSEIAKAPESGYSQDGEDGNVFSGWYNYNMESHVINPKAGYIFIIHTQDGKYVKMEVSSYYQGAPAEPTSEDVASYYTFKYVIQPDGSRDF